LRVAIDAQKLQSLLRDFYMLTKIRIVVYDTDMVEVACYPDYRTAFCTILRHCKQAKTRCDQCDKAACDKSRQQKKTVIYRCHAGLIEAVAPIQFDHTILGYVMFGQILQTEDYDTSWQETEEALKEFPVDVEVLKSAFYQTKKLSSETIASAARLMQACAGYFYLSKAISLAEESVESRIDRYIHANYQETIDAEHLCSLFSVSKTRLYEISETNYGCGIAQKIRQIRIEKAMELLASSEHKISEISAMCGIPDYNYFTKIFKKYTGLTPREYRRQNKIPR